MLAFYAWLRRHPTLVDSVLAVAVAFLGVSVLGGRSEALPKWVEFCFVLAMCSPLAKRRKYPLGVFLTVIVAGALQVASFDRPVGSDVAVLVALYTLAAYRPRRIAIPGLVVCLLGSAVAIARWAPESALQDGYTVVEMFAVFSLPALTAWLLGDMMRWRRGYYKALEERAARLERERDAQAQIAAAAERARITRELHDVIAHNVSVMVVQADGASYALDTDTERTRQALAAISATGRQALMEMRSLLGILRTTGDDPELAPQPGIEQLTVLLEQARATGLPVSFTVEGVPRRLPQGAALTAYRVVQESLTNARKHGGPSVTASVTLRFCEREVAITVADDGTMSAKIGDGHGHGLIGMRERVELYGGTVSAGPRPGGGFRVAATLPVPAPGESAIPGVPPGTSPGVAPETGTAIARPGWEAA